jgi:hypothetical protein
MAAGTLLRSTGTHALLAGCALAAGLWWGGRRESNGPPAPHPLAAAPARVGVREWPQALEEARQRDLPVLLLMAPPHHLCPPARSLSDLIFKGAGAEALAECAVTASLEVDMASPTQVEAELLARVGETTLPCLLVLASDGRILERRFGDLYPIYDVDMTPLAGSGVASFPDVPSLIAMVDAAVGRGARETRRIDALRSSPDAGAWLEASLLLERQGSSAAALAETRRALARGLSAPQVLRAARLLMRQGQEGEAVVALEAALGRTQVPGERARLALLLDRLQGLPQRASTSMPSLAGLLEQAQQRDDAEVVLAVRIRRARAAHLGGDRRALPDDLAWCRDHLASLPADPEEGVPLLQDLLELASVAEQPALRVAFMKALMERFPDHPAAQGPRHTQLCAAERQAGLR